LSGIFVADGKNEKSKKKEIKTSVQHIHIRLIGGCVNDSNLSDPDLQTTSRAQRNYFCMLQNSNSYLSSTLSSAEVMPFLLASSSSTYFNLQ